MTKAPQAHSADVGLMPLLPASGTLSPMEKADYICGSGWGAPVSPGGAPGPFGPGPFCSSGNFKASTVYSWYSFAFEMM